MNIYTKLHIAAYQQWIIAVKQRRYWIADRAQALMQRIQDARVEYGYKDRL